jgi:hypothetical protein
VGGEHYRLNMPFELGLDLGCRRFGGAPYSEKRTLVLEEQKYRYQATISDLSGSDIASHDGNYATAVRKVRNWLTELGSFEIIGASKVVAEYEDFQEWYIERQIDVGFSEEDILDYSTAELLAAMFEWLEAGRPRE